MSVKFDIKLTVQDMYRFNLHHAYTSFQGILSIVLGFFIIGVIVVSNQFQDFYTAVPYLLLAVVFLLYIPVTLRFRSKRQVLLSDVLKDVLHFSMDDAGVTVSSDTQEEPACLPWEYIYKAVTTKHSLLLYSNRVNAYVIPKDQVQEQWEEICNILDAKLPDHRKKIKR